MFFAAISPDFRRDASNNCEHVFPIMTKILEKAVKKFESLNLLAKYSETSLMKPFLLELLPIVAALPTTVKVFN